MKRIPMKPIQTPGSRSCALVVRAVIPFLSVVSATIGLAQTPAFKAPPGQYTTSWVGNSFPGDGGPNGQGYWVQNGADEIEVTPDGTVIAGTDWDEAGRCIGLYKDGQVNRVLLKKERGRESAWGWSTGNRAVAADGTNIFIANTGGQLLRFTWMPGNLNSAKFSDEQEMPDKALGLAAKEGVLALVYTNQIDLRRASDFSRITHFTVASATDVAFAPDHSLWVLAGTNVKHFDVTGVELFSGLDFVAKPTALAFDQRGRLIVCDDGQDQQVKIFDVGEAIPKLVSTFGDQGGIRSGTPGASSSTKLYALRGAGTDSAGNLYVALGFNGAPVGTLVVRSFTPDGKLRWELANHAFVDTFGFDPDADGKVVYSRTALFDLDLESGKGGLIWRQRATTVDHITYPGDSRASSAMTVFLRHLQGRRLLYGIGQYGGGYQLFAFDGSGGLIARPVGRITAPGETWAWNVSENGDIWHGDAQGRTIHRFRFLGWSDDALPRFETAKPDSWPWPDDFEVVRRVHYEAATDTLYVSGYLKSDENESWGVVGKTLRRYDGWVHGNKTVRWTIRLPVNPKGTDKGTPLSPQSFAVAGDYIFVGMVKPEENRQPTHILKANDGTYVGGFVPGPEVGGNAGWQDMPYALAAMKRQNGEYLVLVEEDWRGKNLLYRWTP